MFSFSYKTYFCVWFHDFFITSIQLADLVDDADEKLS